MTPILIAPAILPPSPPSPSPRESAFVAELQTERPLYLPAPDRKLRPPECLDLSTGVRFGALPDELLASAWHELRRTLPENPAGPEVVLTRPAAAGSRECFRLTTAPGRIEIGGDTTEALRRGIYELQSRALASPFLPFGTSEYTMRIRNRISRGFFSPIKRPPFQLDELLDDFDYYPEAYLERLASEGINGLWITVKWREICATPFIAADPQRGKRLEKLNTVVEKCRRYGIGIWAFSIEPAAWAPGEPLLRHYPELGGARIGNDLAFCPTSAVAEEYLYTATFDLFRSVEHLAGILNITHGERATNCLTALECTEDIPVECPRCGRIPKPEIIANTLRPMFRGMIDANPAAQLISWFYMPQAAPRAPWVFELPHAIPEGVILQYNCESNAAVEQLGKIRRGGDYWLSIPDPAEDFVRIARGAREHHIGCCAKLQVTCSHEVATVPFVPVPSLLFEKYRALRELGVEHACQCWYFGNSPGLMNQAANLLSREPFFPTEDEFLQSLTRPQWGESATQVASALRNFARAYEHYPVSNQMQYYGPAHCGLAWPLHLRLEGTPLAPTWRPDFAPSGDTIGECLDNHTLREAIVLFDRLSCEWSEGMERLRAVPLRNPEQEKDFGVCRALELQFAGAGQILRFYELRRQFLFEGNRDVLPELETIVGAEIDRSRELAVLARQDSRLGFHSEAERHLYYPELLEWRCKQLQQLLETDLAEAGRGVSFADRLPVPVLRINQWYATEALHFAVRPSREGGLEVAMEFQLPEDARNVEFADVYWVDPAGVKPVRRIQYFRQRGDLTFNNCDARIAARDATGCTLRLPPELKPDCAYFHIQWNFTAPDGSRATACWPAALPLPAYRLNLGAFAWRNCARLI